MKHYYLLVLLLVIPFLSKAQSNFKSGYVITSNGDTLRGSINYKEWERNPESIQYKQTTTDKAKEFTSADIKYFEVSGFEYYQAATVRISLGTNDLDKLSSTPDTTTKTGNVFLRILQTGKNVTLYSYYDGDKLRFYVSDNSMSTPQELLYRKYLNPNDKTTIITRNIYQGQLSTIANNHNTNSDKLSSLIIQSKYSATDLMKIITEINGASVGNPSKQSSSRAKARLFAGVGGISTTLKYTGDGAASPVVGHSASSVSPKISIGFDGYINPNVGQLVFRFEISGSFANYSLTGTSLTSSIAGTTATQQVKLIYATISPQLIYNFFNTAALKVYLGAGLGFNLAAYLTNQTTTQIPRFTGITTQNDPQLENFWLSIPLKTGITLNKKIDLYALYVPSATMTNYDSFNGAITMYGVGINYIFGK